MSEATLSTSKYTLGQPMFSFYNVGVTYGDRPIIREVTFDFPDVQWEGRAEGQIGVLLGISGIGKTTFLRIAAGFEKPTTGKVLVGVDQSQAKIGRVAIVDQHCTLFQALTVRQNLIEASRCGGFSDVEGWRQAQELLSLLELEKRANDYPITLSGGETQRVAMIRAFLSGTDLLFLDEPFARLDFKSEKVIWAIMKKMISSREHLTMMIITHDLLRAAVIGDFIWALGYEKSNGVIVPGAKVMFAYNMIDLGMRYQTELKTHPKFVEFAQKLEKQLLEVS